MKYSHVLNISILSDKVEEFSCHFYGSSLELQQLELVLRGKIKPENQYEQSCYDYLWNLTAAFTGILEYTMSVEYNPKCKVPEGEHF